MPSTTPAIGAAIAWLVAFAIIGLTAPIMSRFGMLLGIGFPIVLLAWLPWRGGRGRTMPHAASAPAAAGGAAETALRHGTSMSGRHDQPERFPLMDSYHIALFVHLLTLIVAASVTAVTKLAAGRRQRARTIGEVLEWHDILMSAARLFPICLVFFIASGAYMLGVSHAPVWTSAYVVAGLAGVVLLFASGAFLGAKGRAFRAVLAGMASHGADRPAPRMAPPVLVATLPTVNTGIALAVVFDMVTKPASFPVALGVVALGIGLGAIGIARRPMPQVEQARAA